MTLEDFLKLEGLVRCVVADELEKRGANISHTQWRLLHLIAAADRGGQELAQVIGFSKQAVSRDMLELTRAGLVTSAQHGDDGRRRIYSLTTAGLELEAALTSRARFALRRAGMAVELAVA